MSDKNMLNNKTLSNSFSAFSKLNSNLKSIIISERYHNHLFEKLLSSTHIFKGLSGSYTKLMKPKI